MATATIKTTYSLTPDIVSAIERLAVKFGISKSEVIRRAVRRVDEENQPPQADGVSVTYPQPVSPEAAKRVAALRELSARLCARGVDFDAWQRDVREARR